MWPKHFHSNPFFSFDNNLLKLLPFVQKFYTHFFNEFETEKKILLFQVQGMWGIQSFKIKQKPKLTSCTAKTTVCKKLKLSREAVQTKKNLAAFWQNVVLISQIWFCFPRFMNRGRLRYMHAQLPLVQWFNFSFSKIKRKAGLCCEKSHGSAGV